MQGKIVICHLHGDHNFDQWGNNHHDGFNCREDFNWNDFFFALVGLAPTGHICSANFPPKLPIFTQPHHFSHFHSTPKPTNFHSTPPGKIFYLIKKAYKFQSPLESFPFSLFLSFSPSPCIICTQPLHLLHLNPAKTVPQGNIDILKE